MPNRYYRMRQARIAAAGRDLSAVVARDLACWYAGVLETGMKLRPAALALGLVLLSAAGSAQTQTPSPASAPPTQATPCIDLSAKPAPKEREGLFSRAGRMIGMGGASATAQQNVCPLSTGQKFKVWVQKSYSPVNIIASAMDAGVWQATQPASEGGYGQGWDAYGARFGASLANTESSRFFGAFLFPALLHQDPRYFREARGTKGHRFWYALSRVAVTRTDDGRHTFNSSEVLGAFAAAALTNTYYPNADRTAGRTFGAAGLNLGTAAGMNALYEFGPDILNKFKKKKKP